jgi:hypothetical protein
MRSNELIKNGFKGPISVGFLQQATAQWGLLSQRIRADIPPRAGVYAVITPPGYVWSLRIEVHRGKHLHLRADERDSRCQVLGTDIVYIGKAGGPDEEATLQGRIKTLIRHGLGATNKHRGGERIWLLERDETLLLYWKESDTPKAMEDQLLVEFMRQPNGRLPFGNRQRPSASTGSFQGTYDRG